MTHITLDERLFFDGKQAAFPLYEAVAGALLSRYPGTRVRVGKTQITFSERYVYACVSLRPVRRKAELPVPFLTVTLGLPGPLVSSRVAQQTEPYPGRWTVHIPIGSPGDVDGELLTWVEAAHDFALSK